MKNLLRVVLLALATPMVVSPTSCPLRGSSSSLSAGADNEEQKHPVELGGKVCGDNPIRGAEGGSLCVGSEKTIPEKVVSWYTDNLSHGSVALLMAVESSFIPFPSEIVVPPAAYAACDPESRLCVTGNRAIDVALVVLAGTLGALVGAFINYGLAKIFGRPLVNWFANSRFGHACLVPPEKVERAENFFVRYGAVSTFFGRLVPVVRQLISIPAGLAKMPILPFTIFTFCGAVLWNSILALIGLWANGQQEIISKYSQELSIAILVAAVLFCAFLVFKFLSTKENNSDS